MVGSLSGQTIMAIMEREMGQRPTLEEFVFAVQETEGRLWDMTETLLVKSLENLPCSG